MCVCVCCVCQGYAWQTCYMSPNEGGSGASTVLFIDFCVVMLGWSALRDIAKKSGGSASTWSSLPPSLAVATLEPTLLQRKATRRVSTRSGAAGDDGLPKGVPQGPEAFSAIQAWAKVCRRRRRLGCTFIMYIDPPL